MLQLFILSARLAGQMYLFSCLVVDLMVLQLAVCMHMLSQQFVFQCMHECCILHGKVLATA